MLPQLPAEIIAEIFEYFQYDIKSIYSCVQVNRMWCKIAIPVLWRFPTQHKFLLSNNKFWSSISRIIISCLSDDSVKHIIRLYESNNLPFLQSRSSYSSSYPSSSLRPLFNYLLFWNTLTHSDINNIKKSIFLNVTSIHVDYIIEDELYRNFLSYGSRLKYLQLPYNIRLTKYPEAQYTLMNIQYLRCDANTSTNYYNELAIYCCTLKKLIIDIWGKDNEGLANFIKSQHSLQHFEIHSQIIQIYPLIADALCTQVDSLKYLRIVGNPCFKSSVIGRFKKLKTLSLENFNHHVEVLEDLKFPELENLDIICDTITSFEVYKEIIEGASPATRNDNNFDNDNEGLANFIKSQHSLQHFEIHSQIIQIYPLIADALCTQVDSLKYLRIVGNPCFKSSVIGRFKKLKTLSLENFNHHVEVLEDLKFPELENLDIICDTITSFEVYKEIIEGASPATRNDNNFDNGDDNNFINDDDNNNNNINDDNNTNTNNNNNNNNNKEDDGGLKRIYWSSLSKTVDFNPRVYVEFVINYCPNLWFISIYIKDNSLTELEVLLSNLKKLEGIEIQVDDKTDITKLFDILCIKSPSDLKFLIFVGNCEWMVLPEMLESFFLEWGKKRKNNNHNNHNNLKIYFQEDIIDSENYKIIKKYNKKGIIQVYVLNFDNIFQIEEIRNRFGYDDLSPTTFDE
ncbi:hypothetical protein Glove_535g27 [Diversispora epigaea]|uniref:F-box domain-containing protein n=1 Tax=Diversispora epigaea TaxID=1348612 RepID=A0A397GEX2_9GLOM|nr:hypothetical protein Glove_535g27 [Diversispora epigaea]